MTPPVQEVHDEGGLMEPPPGESGRSGFAAVFRESDERLSAAVQRGLNPVRSVRLFSFSTLPALQPSV